VLARTVNAETGTDDPVWLPRGSGS